MPFDDPYQEVVLYALIARLAFYNHIRALCRRPNEDDTTDKANSSPFEDIPAESVSNKNIFSNEPLHDSLKTLPLNVAVGKHAENESAGTQP
jgi:hypothetical protein